MKYCKQLEISKLLENPLKHHHGWLVARLQIVAADVNLPLDLEKNCMHDHVVLAQYLGSVQLHVIG